MSNFTFKKIDAPGPTGTYAYISVNGVDAAGEAVGNYGNVDGDGDGTFHGFTAQAGGSFATYDPPNSTNTDVVGITSAGEIFGDYVDNLNRQYGFVDNNGVFTQINVFLANSTTVSGVNDAGVIYGSFADFANSVHGFIDNSGTFTQIDVPGATSTSIAGVNASGVIVGTFTDAASTVHGFVDSNGSFKTIDPPGSIFTSVVGVSDSGVVVGNYQDNANNQHSFVYADGVFTTINIPGAANTGITAINAVGEIVGYYADSSGNIHGFVDEYGAITTVDVPGATETDILGVNAIGEITGYYNDSSYTQHGFVGTLPPPVTIEAAGATSLLQSGNYFFLSNSGGSELVLQAAPGDVVNENVYGSWSPIGAEQIAGGGYLVAWKEAGANLYSVWTADSTGTAISSLNYVTGSDYRLELDEALMHQDLNGDGVIGLAVPTGGVLEVASTESTAATFIGSTGTLQLDAPSTFTGEIVGFSGNGTLAGSDHIDLVGFTYNSSIQSDSTYNSSTGILIVNNGTAADFLFFTGSYSQANFQFASDGDGGTIVYDPPTTGQSTAATDPADAITHITGYSTITGSAGLGNGQVVVDSGATLTLNNVVASAGTITNNGTVDVTNNSTVSIAAGTGQDSFVFAPNFGQATLTHFAPGIDSIQIDHTVFASLDALFAAIHDDAHGNAVITDAAHDTITVQNVTTAQLLAHQGDFHLV